MHTIEACLNASGMLSLSHMFFGTTKFKVVWPSTIDGLHRIKCGQPILPTSSSDIFTSSNFSITSAWPTSYEFRSNWGVAKSLCKLVIKEHETNITPRIHLKASREVTIKNITNCLQSLNLTFMLLGHQSPPASY